MSGETVNYLTTLDSDVQMCKEQQNKVSLNIMTPDLKKNKKSKCGHVYDKFD